MDLSPLIMWLGFGMSAYAVVANDVIQTLGTFLTSNENNVRWGILWLYAAAIVTIVLTLGWFDPFDWYNYDRGVAYGRLDDFDMPKVYSWYYLIPPFILIIITRFGIPVSTTFMVLALFSLNDTSANFNDIFSSETMLGEMIQKSLIGYLVAFIFATIIFIAISGLTEKYFTKNPLTKKQRPLWMTIQWAITGFLWWQWLTQDLANIYIYLRGGDNKSGIIFFASLILILALLAYVFKRKGGAVQTLVREKVNVIDIRSASFVDLIYGIALYVFKYDYFGLWGATIPMSTTWLFIGLLAGREIGIRFHLDDRKISKKTRRMILADLFKVTLGLVVSIVLVFLIKILAM